MNAELIARLEAAEVGSIKLDGELRWVLEGTDYAPSNYTTSLDAALALAERCLGLGSWRIERESENSFWVKLWLSNNDRSFHSHSNAKTAPLSLAAAILRALDAQEKEK